MSFTWDANGNLLSDGSKTYTYDHANRLKTVSGTGVSASYRYNGLGDRLEETVDGQTTRLGDQEPLLCRGAIFGKGDFLIRLLDREVLRSFVLVGQGLLENPSLRTIKRAQSAPE